MKYCSKPFLLDKINQAISHVGMNDLDSVLSSENIVENMIKQAMKVKNIDLNFSISKVIIRKYEWKSKDKSYLR